MVEEKIYRAGAIGRTGGGNYGHGIHLGYQGHERIEFVSVADPDEEGRQRAKAETGAKRTYADYKEMLERESLDLVSVCPRWVDCHLEMVLACVEAGCHVYCEKPMAMRLDDADRMVSAADCGHVRIAVAHQGVYLPQTREAKRLVESGRIGIPHTVYAWGKQDHRGGGEDTMVLGTHLFNTMRFFFSEVAWMFAHVTVEGREIGPGDVRDGNEPIGPVAGDCVESCFSFQSGVSGFFRSRANSHPGDRPYGMEIAGQEGRLALWGGSPDQIFLYPYGGSAPSGPDRAWQRLDVETAPYTEGNRRAIQDLIQSIEEDRDPLSSGRDATSALEMILGAYESQITGGRVEFPMVERTHPLDRLRRN